MEITAYALAVSLFVLPGAKADAISLPPGYEDISFSRTIKNHPNSGIIGKDDRVKPLGIFSALKNSIGLLVGPEGHSSCTAFCISPDTIVSAAHCLFQIRRGKKRKHVHLDQAFFFLKAQSQYAMAGILGRDHNTTNAGIVAGNKKGALPKDNFPKDWMILKLKTPICSHGLPLIDKSTGALTKESRNKHLFMVGFHGDKLDEGLLVSKNCSIRSLRKTKSISARTSARFRKSGSILLHNCDAFPGASGSPILLQNKGELYVAAMNVGTITSYRHTMRGRKIIKSVIRGKTNIGVLAKAFQPLAEWMKTNTPLTEKNDLISLQIMLNDAGFKPGKSDGIAGPKTRRAIKAYEQAHKMTVTGIPSVKVSNITAMEFGKRIAAKNNLPVDTQTLKACLFMMSQREVKPGEIGTVWAACLRSKAANRTANSLPDRPVNH